jgi:hypothetical protein
MKSARHLLVLIGFAPAAIANTVLWQLPVNAAANGAGDGRAWPAATIATVCAGLALIACVIIAWKSADRRPRIVPLLTVLATITAVAGRRIAVSGAPEEFYLVDDAKLWIVLLGVSVVIASVLAFAFIEHAASPRRT